MKIIKSICWDAVFFQKFVDFKNSLYIDEERYLSESIEDLEKIFNDESPLVERLSPISYLVFLEGQDVIGARFTLLFPKNSDVIYLGFLEITAFHDVWKKIDEIIRDTGRDTGRSVCYGPFDGSIFTQHRLQAWSKISPFFKSPVHKDYYHQFFHLCDFKVHERWYNQRLHLFRTLKNFLKIKEKFNTRESLNDLKIRTISLLKWDQEVRVIYDLFMDSYSEMSLFEKISFAEFQIYFNDYKKIINPLLSYIVEKKGYPVAFLITYFDPLELILEQRKAHSSIKLIELFNSLFFQLKMKLNHKRLLMAYVGKRLSKNGEEIKGIQSLFSQRIFTAAKFLNCAEVLVLFNEKNSPAQRSFNPENQDLVSEYVLYKKDLK